MCPSMTPICPSELFTVFTVVLRCTVNRAALIFQRVEWCIYGFYGFFPYTPPLGTYIFFKNWVYFKRVRARNGVCDTVKSVKSVNDVPETLINQRAQVFTVFKTHRKKSAHTVNKCEVMNRK